MVLCAYFSSSIFLGCVCSLIRHDNVKVVCNVHAKLTERGTYPFVALVYPVLSVCKELFLREITGEFPLMNE